ncbi:MAG TPA: AAA family ATPase, partial [Solirubrobacteraceae bacterium]|nr:AAA family ATPase [Solirubrobacteraceae bacterium]
LAAALTEAARTRRCSLATVVGEPGVGKSRLVAELCASAAGGARVVSGRCLSYGEGITFWPLAEIVRDAAGIRAEDDAPQARERIRRLVGGWAADRVAAAIGLQERAAPAEEIAAAFRELLQALAAERPLVCVVEDLHWAEPTLLDLLEQVAERAAAPLVLLCTARPELLQARPDWPVSVRLEPLDREASERLLDELSDGAAPSGEPRARMLAAAGGVPLFLEELLAAQRERPGDAVLPQTLRALLTARLDRLPERERAAAERGAVEGEVFHRGAVRALWAGGGTAAHAAVEALAAADVVRPAAPAIPSEVAYRFRHILIRDAAYASTAKRLRAELHERFADWLEAAVGSRLPEYEEIAGYHLEQAHRLHAELGPAGERGARLARRAATHLVAAGQRAGARGDDRALVGLLRRAAALLGGDDPQRALLLAQIAAALLELGEFAAADEALAEGDRAARAAGDARMRAHVDLGRELLHNQVRGDFDQRRLRRTAERAVDVFGRAGDDRGLAHAYRALAWVELTGARGAPMREAVQRSIEHARRAGDRRQEIEAVFLLAPTLACDPTPCPQAIALCRRVLSEQAGERKVEGLARQALGELVAMQGRFEDARRHVEAGRAIMWDLGLTLFMGAQYLGEVELLAGDPGAAEVAFREDYERLSAIGETGFFSGVAFLLADAVHRQGRHAEAVAFTEAAEAASAPGDVLSQAGWRSVRAKARARLGDDAAAQRLARGAVAAIARSDFPNARGSTLMDVAEVRALTGDPCGARAACLAARAEFARKGCRVAVARAEAELAALSAAP